MAKKNFYTTPIRIDLTLAEHQAMKCLASDRNCNEREVYALAVRNYLATYDAPENMLVPPLSATTAEMFQMALQIADMVIRHRDESVSVKNTSNHKHQTNSV